VRGAIYRTSFFGFNTLPTVFLINLFSSNRQVMQAIYHERDNIFQIRLTMWDPCIKRPPGPSCGPAAARLLRLWVRTRRMHAIVSIVSVVCCQVEVCATI